MNKSILVIDDSANIRKIVKLTFDGIYEVLAAENGEHAFELIKTTTPDLVLVDANMPGMSGYEVCRILKKNKKFEFVPIILMIGTFDTYDEEQGKLARFDLRISKPFESEFIVKTVIDELERAELKMKRRAPVTETPDEDFIEHEKEEQVQWDEAQTPDDDSLFEETSDPTALTDEGADDLDRDFAPDFFESDQTPPASVTKKTVPLQRDDFGVQQKKQKIEDVWEEAPVKKPSRSQAWHEPPDQFDLLQQVQKDINHDLPIDQHDPAAESEFTTDEFDKIEDNTPSFEQEIPDSTTDISDDDEFLTPLTTESVEPDNEATPLRYGERPGGPDKEDIEKLLEEPILIDRELPDDIDSPLLENNEDFDTLGLDSGPADEGAVEEQLPVQQDQEQGPGPQESQTHLGDGPPLADDLADPLAGIEDERRSGQQEDQVPEQTTARIDETPSSPIELETPSTALFPPDEPQSVFLTEADPHIMPDEDEQDTVSVYDEEIPAELDRPDETVSAFAPEDQEEEQLIVTEDNLSEWQPVEGKEGPSVPALTDLDTHEEPAELSEPEQEMGPEQKIDSGPDHDADEPEIVHEMHALAFMKDQRELFKKPKARKKSVQKAEESETGEQPVQQLSEIPELDLEKMAIVLLEKHGDAFATMIADKIFDRIIQKLVSRISQELKQVLSEDK